jgi:hypothetical protein
MVTAVEIESNGAHGMRFPVSFYRFAAVCSWISALTTCGLIFLPELYAPIEGFEGRMQRVHDPAYVLRSWVYLLHPFFTGAAALAVAIRLRRVAPALVIPGLIGFLLWAATEAAQQAVQLMAFDRWRVAYVAGDAAVRSTMELRTVIFDGIWDAMYFLLLLAFFIGNVLYAIALWRGRALSKAVSAGYVGAALLTAFIISNEVGGPGLPPSMDAWLYPAIQPLARTLIGVWLWRPYTDGGIHDPLGRALARA